MEESVPPARAPIDLRRRPMKRMILVAIALTAMACTVQTRPDPVYASQPPPPPPEPATSEPPPHRPHRPHRPRPSDPAPAPAPLPPPSTAPSGSGWSGRGYTLIQEFVPDPARPVAVVVVKNETAPQRIALVVEDDDFLVDGVLVRYWHPTNAETPGQNWDAGVQQNFVNGSRVRVIDLRGNRSAIRTIEIRYRNLVGRPRVQVWFANAGAVQAPVPTQRPTPAPAAPWNSAGHTMLGKQALDPQRGHVLIASSNRVKAPQSLVFTVEGGEVEIANVVVQHGHETTPNTLGPKNETAVNHTFSGAAPTKVIDMRGNRNPVRTFDVSYKVLSGRPVLQIWASGI
jgi:hypothetical protein